MRMAMGESWHAVRRVSAEKRTQYLCRPTVDAYWVIFVALQELVSPEVQGLIG